MSTKASGAFSLRIDRTAERRMLGGYSPDAVEHILKEASKVGAQDAAKVMRSAAPVGTASRLGQYYRRMSLAHGTFRKSVRAAAIRGRGSAIKGLQDKTIGQVIGPIGKTAFTRAWIELGTTHSRANPWVEKVSTVALGAAQRGSDAVLSLYARGH